MAKLTAAQAMRIKIGARIIEQHGMQSFWAFVAANKSAHEQKLQTKRSK
jgi:hypothetical protein